MIDEEEAVEEYLDTMEHAAAMRAQIRAILHTPRNALPFLQPGRLVKLLRNVPGALYAAPAYFAATPGAGMQG